MSAAEDTEMDERTRELIGRTPTVSDVLQENDSELAAPVRFAIRFEAEAAALLIEAVPADDTVSVSVRDVAEVDSAFVVAPGLIAIMKGQRIESIVRTVNMQGYLDGVELHGVRSPAGGERGGLPVFRFEVGASMVFFSHGVFTEPRV